jgi:uncharacterized protein
VQNDGMVSIGLLPRLLEAPRSSFFLFGPRGTGKSTWLRGAFPRAHTLSLLDEALYHELLGDPGRFADELRALSPQTWVVVDEVQRLPSLLNEVHRFIEERRLRFVLCGSSARKLKREGTNLLAGRAVRRTMHPLVPEELGDEFVLEDVLRFGSLPVIWRAENRRDALDAYAQMYIREEIQAEALVRSLAGFVRMLPVAAIFHGQVINVAAVARDAGVARTTVVGYLEILRDTLVAFELPAFESRLRVRERRHPKFFWVDPGLPRAIRRQLGPVTTEERGALFEGWVATVLRAYADYRELFDDWAYWATGAGVEVDFLLRKGDEFVAIEAKSTTRVDRRDLGGLRALVDLPGVVRRILVHRGTRRQLTEDGIEILPVRAWLDELEQGSLFAGAP